MHTIYVAKGDNNAQLLKYSIKSSLLTIILATIKSNTCNNIRQTITISNFKSRITQTSKTYASTWKVAELKDPST